MSRKYSKFMGLTSKVLHVASVINVYNIRVTDGQHHNLTPQDPKMFYHHIFLLKTNVVCTFSPFLMRWTSTIRFFNYYNVSCFLLKKRRWWTTLVQEGYIVLVVTGSHVWMYQFQSANMAVWRQIYHMTWNDHRQRHWNKMLKVIRQQLANFSYLRCIAL